MKRLFLILPLTAVIACNNSTTQKKSPVFLSSKYYILSPNIDITMLREIELKFISDSFAELTPTLITTIFDYRTYKNDPSLKEESQIVHYTYRDSIIEIPEKHILTKVTQQSNGSLLTNSGELLGTSSILDCHNEDEVRDRISRSLGAYKFLVKSFIALLDEKNRQRPVTKKGDKLYFNSSPQPVKIISSNSQATPEAENMPVENDEVGEQ